MRQLIIQTQPGEGGQALAVTRKFDALNTVQVEGKDREQAWDLVIAHVTNKNIAPLLGELDSLSNVHVTLVPNDVFPMQPPQTNVPDAIRQVTPRSPVEIWLNGLQSIGSWKGFLGYAVAAGIIVWIGMFTNTAYLLVAAMLIAPFAGPAMNVGIGSATGDRELLRQSLLRYITALSVTIAVSALLSLLMQQKAATSTMIATSQLSSLAVLLPLVAGMAGGLNLSQSEKSSLVPGTAAGLLVAASLAPPAGLVGMSAAIGRWDMAQNGVFVLALQLVAINLGAVLIFRAYGMSPQGSRYKRGHSIYFYASVTISVLLLLGMLALQLGQTPSLQRSTRAQRALGELQELVDQSQLAQLVEADLRFTRPSVGDQDTLLGVVYVRPKPGVAVSDEEIRQALTRQIQDGLLAAGFNVVPLIDVTVLHPP